MNAVSGQDIIKLHRAHCKDARFSGFEADATAHVAGCGDNSTMSGAVLAMMHDGIETHVGVEAAAAFVNMINMTTDTVSAFVIVSALERLAQNGWVYDGFRMTPDDAFDFQTDTAMDFAAVARLSQYVTPARSAVMRGHIVGGFLRAHQDKVQGTVYPEFPAPRVI